MPDPPMSTAKPKSTHRYRVCGTPSRLGCITCKVRRVKCDETHPFCSRCTSTGRKCDGYEPPAAPTAPSRRKPPTPIVDNPNEDALEHHYLEYFGVCTAPTLSGNFSPDFWERRVLQAGQVEPSIRHALIAIAAVNHDFNNKQWNRGATDFTLEAFAFRQYTKAISHLHNLMSTSQRLDMTLITCILFICFDCLLGNHASAVMHLKAGLKILEDIKTRNSNKEIRVHEWEREFAPPLLSLGIQVATFISPKFPEERRTLWVSLQNAGLSQQPTSFSTLDEARYALDSLSAKVMAVRSSVHDTILVHETSDLASQGRLFIPDLEAWNIAFDRLLPPFLAAEPPVGKTSRGSTLLKIHALVVSIVIGLAQDAEAKFEKVIALCEFLIAANVSNYGIVNPTFSCDQGIIAPLFLTAWRAPNKVINQRAIDLLSRAPGREGLWDASEAHRVAQDHLDTKSGQPGLVLPGSVSQAEVKIWSDIGARLKYRMTWNLEEGQSAMTDKEPVAIPHSNKAHLVPLLKSAPPLNSSEQFHGGMTMGFQNGGMLTPVTRPGDPPMMYEAYNNE